MGTTRSVRRRNGGGAGAALTLLSSRCYTSSEDRLSTERLAREVRTAKYIDVASAYYDTRFCAALLSEAPANATIRLLFNGLGGARLLEQRVELQELEQTLRKRTPDTTVRLAFEPGIFHTKLLLVESRKGIRAWVGSANATTAAMSVNEELFVEFSGDEAFEAYFERVWTRGAALDGLESRLTAKSLIGFFRTGSLYFKPATSLQITLNPFTELLGGLEDEELRKLAVSLPYSDPDAGIGAFNLRRALELSDAEKDGEEREQTRASIKPFAVETCFGYWVPRAMDWRLQAKLDQAGAKKQARWQQLSNALERTGSTRLRRLYEQYVKAVRELLVQNRVAFARSHDGPKRDPFDASIFDGFIGRVRSALANEGYVRRLCQPFVRGPMPEIWDDPVASSDFSRTFCEYLEYVSQRPGKKSMVPGCLLEGIGLGGAADAALIRATLDKHLRTVGWSDRDWS